MTELEITTAQWLKLKYEYYLSARTLWLNNQMQMGALMFAYAVEAQIKHALVTFPNSCQQRLLNSGHDIPELFKEARKAKIFKGIEVDSSFLNFIQDNFHRRYPRQTKEQMKKANSEGRGLALTPNVLPWYDRFILNLDEWSYQNTSNFKSTIRLEAIKHIESKGGHYFFERNNTAYNSLPLIINLLDKEVEHYLAKPNGADQFNVHLKSLTNKKQIVIKTIDSLESKLPYQEVDLSNFSHPGQFGVLHSINIQL
ncbi:hypothetical protein [Paraglaciecola hydrolytica]|uniref:HEPN domain-containing protein n=1 Tax=Paraglaciecola hydrolytica TaxID=1799789 RepID=A0A136A1A9_9ALTE|nr:hypothetical protein [Paraglaciecola hydrolytica]KXI28977.1 hypothetical protein AX660_12435 [Paraglaciecola hydrolytica]